MNDPILVLDALDRIISELNTDLSFTESCALYAAASTIRADLETFIGELGGDGYAREKLSKTLWSIGAATGFDITNGHDLNQHKVWAMGQAQTLRKVLTEAIERTGD